MTTREFDPVFSAALRNELQHLADGPTAASAPERPHRRWQPVLVTAVTALLLIAATLGVLRLTPITAQPAAPGPHVADPLAEITAPSGPLYIRAIPNVLLRVNGTGPGTWSITIPAGVTSVRPYLNCAPTSSFTLKVDGRGGGTDCAATKSGTFVDLPVKTGQHRVTVHLPAGTRYSLLVIETPVYQPSTPWAAPALLPFPTGDRMLLTEVRGNYRIATGRLSGRMKGVVIDVRCEGTGSVTISTAFGTIGNPASYSSCGTHRVLSSGGGLSGEETVQKPRFTVTPYGRVSWTVTFSRLPD